MSKIEEVIPEQEKGAKTDVEESVTLASEIEAKTFFNEVKNRLLNINTWHDMAGSLTAVFTLTDGSGREITRTPGKGDHFRINIPGPGSKTGSGFDWVRVESIEAIGNPESEEEGFAITVRPASNPENSDESVAHFFKDAATSSFIVKRKGKLVSAAVRGRNELPNAESEKTIDKARNTLVALGAMVGLSNPQWKALVKGLVKK